MGGVRLSSCACAFVPFAQAQKASGVDVAESDILLGHLKWDFFPPVLHLMIFLFDTSSIFVSLPLGTNCMPKVRNTRGYEGLLRRV